MPSTCRFRFCRSRPCRYGSGENLGTWVIGCLSSSLASRRNGSGISTQIPNYPNTQFMRAVIQRVSQASVVISGQTTGTIGRGLLVLLAIEDADTDEDIEWLSGKICRLRIFDDADGVMNLSVQEIAGE